MEEKEAKARNSNDIHRAIRRMIKSFKLPRDAFYYSIIDQFHSGWAVEASVRHWKCIDCRGRSACVIKVNFAKLREKLINRKLLECEFGAWGCAIVASRAGETFSPGAIYSANMRLWLKATLRCFLYARRCTVFARVKLLPTSLWRFSH